MLPHGLTLLAQNRLPACSECARWKLHCVYATPRTADLPMQDTESLGQLPRNSDPMQSMVQYSLLDGVNIDLDSPPSLFGSLTPCSGQLDPSILSMSLTPPSTTSLPESLPSFTQVMEIVQLFFQHNHKLLPCIHQESFVNILIDIQAAADTPLLWSILAVVGQTSKGMQYPHEKWHDVAIRLYEQSVRSNGPVLRDAQAAVWNACYDYIQGDLLQATSRLAQGFSVACMHGLNRIDDDYKPLHLILPLNSAVEEEECRWTMWAFYLLDRQVNYLHGVHFAVNDRIFMVEYPCSSLSESSERIGQYPRSNRQIFTRDLASLSYPPLADQPFELSIHQFTQKAFVLLGRIVEYQNMVTPDTDHQQRADEFLQLKAALVKTWVTVTHSLSMNAVGTDSFAITRLHVTLHTCSVILDYPTSACAKNVKVSSIFVRGAGGVTFLRAFKAIQSMIDVIKERATAAESPFMGSFLAPSYFLACRFLSARWRHSQEEVHRRSLFLLMGLLEQLSDSGVVFAQRLRDMVFFDLQSGDIDNINLVHGSWNQK
ncbi:hypothetical protein UA08_01298 [Talaromyces atroroseus]|uniref:Xylanolytic transcriptional activator regulatory domain-containing protein n=1 Tax=Talaromyces atroroseus TaxID=1441469 RepID=A0A1Q5QAC4_TALAT|nr:hypothetical protein UA08_01298 [Talaromyces atroroseus]OKL62882.1 hypothetical protein UA08_01298 [Talaromyces atroroseus]